MSLDISLMRFQAYRAEEKIIVTVSQLYPAPDVEDFRLALARSSKFATDAETLPEVAWTKDDLSRLRELAGAPCSRRSTHAPNIRASRLGRSRSARGGNRLRLERTPRC